MTASRQFVVAMDVDEVCADLLGTWLRWYNREWGDNLTPDRIRGWALAPQVKPECGDRIYDILKNPALYSDVDPLPGALSAVCYLRSLGIRVVFVSSCVAGSVDAKVAWLQHNGFLPKGSSIRDFIACTDKALIGADVLLDDHILNVESFPGHAILLNVPHNSEEKCSRPRAMDMMEAVAMIVQRAGIPIPCSEGQTAP